MFSRMKINENDWVLMGKKSESIDDETEEEGEADVSLWSSTKGAIFWSDNMGLRIWIGGVLDHISFHGLSISVTTHLSLHELTSRLCCPPLGCLLQPEIASIA
jgi:hypothetical protein